MRTPAHGNFLLHNALRLDFYIEKKKDLFDAVFSMDNHTICMRTLEDEREALFFLSLVEKEIRQSLLGSSPLKLSEIDLNTICEIALEKLISTGVPS